MSKRQLKVNKLKTEILIFPTKLDVAIHGFLHLTKCQLCPSTSSSLKVHFTLKIGN